MVRFPNFQPHREMLRNSQATQAEEHKGVNSTIARLNEDLESTKRNYEEQVGCRDPYTTWIMLHCHNAT